MKINQELFVIPNEKDFFLYLPLEKNILKVNSGVVKYLQKVKNCEETKIGDKIKNRLFKTRVLLENEKNKLSLFPKINHEYKPYNVTLVPTWDCNLRCIYCYSSGGEKIGDLMKFDIAKASIDFIIKNAKEKGHKKVRLGFHGGGEPLLNKNIDFIKKVTEYFKEKGEKNKLKTRVSSATNGVLNRKNLEWICNNFNYLNLSFDGPKDIQDRQRPMENGSGSFEFVIKTVEYLEGEKFPYSIRTTITKESTSRMPEIVEFFGSISNAKKFHFEPLFECGRCKTTKTKAVSPKEFLKYMILAKEKAERLKAELYYSGGELEGIRNYFCGATGTNFFVTPPGDVTACLEVSRVHDNRAKIFFIGKYNKDTKKISFQNERIEKLRERRVEKIVECKDCFAKYNCAGDCLAKTYVKTKDLYSVSGNSRCKINRNLLLHEIKNKFQTLEKQVG